MTNAEILADILARVQTELTAQLNELPEDLHVNLRRLKCGNALRKVSSHLLKDSE